MAREILFKAKRNDNGMWIEGYYVYKKYYRITKQGVPKYEGYKHFIHNDMYGFMLIDENTLCQYTGLTDKNRNKIWENDIASFSHSKLKDINCDNAFGIPNFQTVKYQRNYVIEFVDTFCTYGLRFRNGSIHFPCKHSTCRMHDVEVIGNVFDNPELLKEE